MFTLSFSHHVNALNAKSFFRRLKWMAGDNITIIYEEICYCIRACTHFYWKCLITSTYKPLWYTVALLQRQNFYCSWRVPRTKVEIFLLLYNSIVIPSIQCKCAYSNPFCLTFIMESSKSYTGSIHFYSNRGSFLQFSDIFLWANRAESNHRALLRAVWSGSSMFAYAILKGHQT